MANLRIPERYIPERYRFIEPPNIEQRMVPDIHYREMQLEMDRLRYVMMIQMQNAQGEDLSKAPRSEPDRKLIPRLGVLLADESEGENALAKEAESLFGYNVLRRKLKLPGKLGEVLACLDIEPLNFDAVEKYKADMVLWRKKEIIEREGVRQRMMEQRYNIDVSWKRIALGKCKEEVPLFALRKAVQVKKACPEVILEVDELIEEKKLIDPFLVARLDDETFYLEVWKEPKFEETL